MKRWNKICGIFTFLSFFVPSLKAQTLIKPDLQAKVPDRILYLGGYVIPSGMWTGKPTFVVYPKFLQKNDNSQILPLLLPADYYAVHQRAFFCRVEMNMEKLTPAWPFQLRVRVGSLQDNDWLEQKPGAIRPQ